MVALLWLATAWAQDSDEALDPEALLLETELAIDALDGDDAIELGILEARRERDEPHVPHAPAVGGRLLAEPVDLLPGRPFGEILARALVRSGDVSTLARDVARARFLPRLTLVVRHEHARSVASDGTTRDARWLAEMRLCLGACGTSLSVDEIDGDVAPDLMVTAGEVVELDDRGAHASTAIRVLEASAESRLALADRLATIYARRSLLRAQRCGTALDEARRLLDLAEADAFLDLYTDGWFTTEAP